LLERLLVSSYEKEGLWGLFLIHTKEDEHA